MDLPLKTLAICTLMVVVRKSCSRSRTKVWALSPRGLNTNDSKNPPRLVYVPSALGIPFWFFLPLFPTHIPYSLRIFNFFIWTSFGLFLTKRPFKPPVVKVQNLTFPDFFQIYSGSSSWYGISAFEVAFFTAPPVFVFLIFERNQKSHFKKFKIKPKFG